MAWIELHQQLRRHPKLLHLARLLGERDPDYVRAKLENIWLWCLDHAEDGVVRIDKRLPLEVWVCEAAGWEGPREQAPSSLPIKKAGPEQAPSSAFADALLESGWIEKTEAGSWGYKLQLHDWQDYAGRLMERRNQDRERKRLERSAGRPRDGDSTVPNRTQPYPTQPGRGGDPPPSAAAGTAEEIAETYFKTDPSVPKAKALHHVQVALERGADARDLLAKVQECSTRMKLWTICDLVLDSKAKNGNHFSPAKTLCLNCGGTGTVAGGVVEGVITQVPCSRCETKTRSKR